MSEINKGLEAELGAFAGGSKNTKSISFGMETLSRWKEKVDVEKHGAGIHSQVKLGKFTVKGDANFLNIKYGHEKDNTTRIPGRSTYFKGDLINLEGEVSRVKNGIQNKIMSAKMSLFGGDASLDVGGKKGFSASADVHKMKSSGSIGFDDGKLINFKNDNKHDIFSADIIPESISKSNEYGESLLGRAGKEKGTPDEIFAGRFNRLNLLGDADAQHNRNQREFKRLDGKNGRISEFRNSLIADKSSGYIDRLNTAIDAAKKQKQEMDYNIKSSNIKTKNAEQRKEKSKELQNEIDSLTEARDSLFRDKNHALDNLGNSIESYKGRKETSQIVSDANKNAKAFEKAFKEENAKSEKKALNDNLAKPAVDVCKSQNELNGRVNELDRRINDNDNLLSKIDKKRNQYLDKQGTTLKDAVDAKDPFIAKINKDEENIRAQSAECRMEKGECKKALLETDKNFFPGEQSAKYEKKGRDLECAGIDNNNAQEAKKDEIANYCNSHGLRKPLDKEGNYLKSDKVEDEGLKNLLGEKETLEKQGEKIEDQRTENKKDLAESENYDSRSVKVSQEDGFAKIEQKEEDYAKHKQSTPELRGEKEIKGNDKDGKDNQKGETTESKKDGDEHARSEPQKDKDSGMSTSNPTKDGTKPEKEKPEGMTTQNPGKETPAPDKNKNEGMSTSNPTKDGTKPEKEKPEGMTTQNPGKETPAPDKNVNEGMSSASKGKEAPKPEKEKSEGMPSANKGEDAPKPEKEKSGGMPTSAPGGSDSKPEKEKSGGMSTTAPGSSGEKAPSPPEKSKNSGMQM